MAVFSPMPFTPGMLSEESPMRAFRSMSFMGSKPYFSRNRASSYSRYSFFPGFVVMSITWVLGPMSCRLSLSPVTSRQSQPPASHFAAKVPSRSSASQPARAKRLMPRASITFCSQGSYSASSSGMPFRVAL